MEDDSHNNNNNINNPESSSSSCLVKSSSTTSNINITINNNKEQDRLLPIANVGRIMKKVVRGNCKISKEAKESVQECVSEFISFVTGEASDKCQREKRKTINGDDIIWAITTLGFDDYVLPLQAYLHKYRDIEGDNKLNHNNNNNNNNNNIPKQKNHHNLHHLNNNNYNNNSVYSSSTSTLMNISHHHPFVPSSDQPFSNSLPFSPNSIHKQLQTHQDQMDDQWGIGE